MVKNIEYKVGKTKEGNILITVKNHAVGKTLFMKEDSSQEKFNSPQEVDAIMRKDFEISPGSFVPSAYTAKGVDFKSDPSDKENLSRISVYVQIQSWLYGDHGAIKQAIDELRKDWLVPEYVRKMSYKDTFGAKGPFSSWLTSGSPYDHLLTISREDVPLFKVEIEKTAGYLMFIKDRVLSVMLKKNMLAAIPDDYLVVKRSEYEKLPDFKKQRR